MDVFYQAALEIARKKLFTDRIDGSVLTAPRLGTGGLFVDIFMWDTVFCALWGRYHAELFPVAESLDNFYRCQEPSGFISRQIHSDGTSKWRPGSTLAFGVPILSWGEVMVEPFLPGRYARRYEALARLHRFNAAHFRRPDGLYFSDGYGCGMDNLPRWDQRCEVTPEGGIPFQRGDILDQGEKGDALYECLAHHSEVSFSWNRQLGWCDTTCQMAFDALNLAKIAHALGKTSEEQEWRAEHRELSELVNTRCYNERTGFYSDRLGDHVLERQTICGFWPMLAEVATPERAARLVEALRDPQRFNRSCAIPTLPCNDPDYTSETGYARGPAWAHTNYMVLKGLDLYGYHDLAVEFAAKFYQSARHLWEKTGTIWENYSPEQCEEPTSPSGRDFCGWSALIPICFYREYLS